MRGRGEPRPRNWRPAESAGQGSDASAWRDRDAAAPRRAKSRRHAASPRWNTFCCFRYRENIAMPVQLFGTVTEGLGAALDLYRARHQVLAENIANSETPGYRARDIEFADQLAAALTAPEQGTKTAGDPKSVASTATSSRRSTGTPRSSPTATRSRSTSRSAKLSENAFKIDALTQILSARYASLKQAIDGGNADGHRGKPRDQLERPRRRNACGWTSSPRTWRTPRARARRKADRTSGATSSSRRRRASASATSLGAAPGGAVHVVARRRGRPAAAGRVRPRPSRRGPRRLRRLSERQPDHRDGRPHGRDARLRGERRRR